MTQLSALPALSVLETASAGLSAPHRTASGLMFTGPVNDLVAAMRPSMPVHLIHTDRIEANARRFMAGFPGTSMYAVKCNPDKGVIRALVRAGISAFDVASIAEVRQIRKQAPKAKLYFMHPVKSREAIAEAYFTHGVRAFVLDTEAELYKIIQETQMAGDIELFVRLAVNNAHAAAPLAGKFGALAADAAHLLTLCRPVCARLGVSFHVGSECLSPDAYSEAIAAAADVIAQSGVTVDVLDVGGGFPARYTNMDPAPLADYFAAVRAAIAAHHLEGLEILAEPGRALVASGGGLIARVELRKDGADGTHTLYLNDGVYGGLCEAAKWQGMSYPVRRVGDDGPAAVLIPYRFAGPTCDSLDMMYGPFMLPADMREGDYIEIQEHGAYGLCTRTGFNGFSSFEKVYIKGA